jgi:hypothetical protein
MDASQIDPGQLYGIDDLSIGTLQMLCTRIEASTSIEQLIYRESELDEVWRLAEGGLADAKRVGAGAVEVGRMESMRALAMHIHDLVGVNEDGPAAAACLRAALRPDSATTQQ